MTARVLPFPDGLRARMRLATVEQARLCVAELVAALYSVAPSHPVLTQLPYSQFLAAMPEPERIIDADEERIIREEQEEQRIVREGDAREAANEAHADMAASFDVTPCPFCRATDPYEGAANGCHNCADDVAFVNRFVDGQD